MGRLVGIVSREVADPDPSWPRVIGQTIGIVVELVADAIHGVLTAAATPTAYTSSGHTALAPGRTALQPQTRR